MNQITVYQTNYSGLFVGESLADESPLEPGVFAIPAGCVETAPPESWQEDQLYCNIPCFEHSLVDSWSR